jgi:hypothetical protein
MRHHDIRQARSFEDRSPSGYGHVETVDFPRDHFGFSSGRHPLDSASNFLDRLPGLA